MPSTGPHNIRTCPIPSHIFNELHCTMECFRTEIYMEIKGKEFHLVAVSAEQSPRDAAFMIHIVTKGSLRKYFWVLLQIIYEAICFFMKLSRKKKVPNLVRPYKDISVKMRLEKRKKQKKPDSRGFLHNDIFLPYTKTWLFHLSSSNFSRCNISVLWLPRSRPKQVGKYFLLITW